MSRWPFVFSLDDIEVNGASVVVGDLAVELDSDRTVGVIVKHKPTGAQVAMDFFSTRDANVQAAFRRLDSELRRRAARQHRAD